jgi:hypothetical protein
MNFEQFAANFRNPEGPAPCLDTPVENPIGEVTIVGTILSIANDICCLEINGVRYEIPTRYVTEIGDVVAAPATAQPSRPETKKKADASVGAGPRLVIIRVPANAVLYTRVAVPALLIAAVGTWVTVAGPQQPSAPAPKAA